MDIFLKTITIYLIVLFIMRIMGKREIGQLQTFEFVISLMIADLAVCPITNKDVPFKNGIIAIFSLLIIHFIISIFNMKNIKIKNIICGKPSILIEKGKINEKNMQKEKFTITELQEKLRLKNIFDIANVEYVILETSGDISIIKKPNKNEVSLEDLNLEREFEGLSYNLIIDGKIIEKNLVLINKDIKWLEEQVKKFKYEIKDVLVFSINAKGNVFCQRKSFKSDK